MYVKLKLSFLFINSIILIILLYQVIKNIDKYNHNLNKNICFINKIKFPKLHKNNNKHIIKCFCKNYIHNIPCIKIYSYNEFIYNINYNKCSLKLNCCDSINTNIYNYSKNIYNKYFNKSITCYSNGNKKFINYNNINFNIIILLCSLLSITVIIFVIFIIYINQYN